MAVIKKRTTVVSTKEVLIKSHGADTGNRILRFMNKLKTVAAKEQQHYLAPICLSIAFKTIVPASQSLTYVRYTTKLLDSVESILEEYGDDGVDGGIPKDFAISGDAIGLARTRLGRIKIKAKEQILAKNRQKDIGKLKVKEEEDLCG